MRSTQMGSCGRVQIPECRRQPADSLPNAALVNDPAVVSDKRLDSPSIAITSNIAQVTFRNNFNLGGQPTKLSLTVECWRSASAEAHLRISLPPAAALLLAATLGRLAPAFSNPLAGRLGVERELRWLYHHDGEPAGGRGRAKYRSALAHG